MKKTSKVVYFLAIGFGSGLIPFMPGTWGTIVALPIYWLLSFLAWPYYLLIVGMMIAIGIWICGLASRDFAASDPPSIVWDEIVGFLLTMAFVPFGWGWVLSGFLLFRLFDIWKPWPIKKFDKQVRGGVGIVGDDIIAAIYAGVMLRLIMYAIY